MAGNAGTRARATAGVIAAATESVALVITSPDDFSTPSIAALPGVGNTTNVDISGVANVVAGTGTTAMVVKCHRGATTGGPQVGNSQSVTLAAAASANIPFEFIDTTVSVANSPGVYCITFTQTGGTGAGTVGEIVAKAETYI